MFKTRTLFSEFPLGVFLTMWGMLLQLAVECEQYSLTYMYHTTDLLCMWTRVLTCKESLVLQNRLKNRLLSIAGVS